MVKLATGLALSVLATVNAQNQSNRGMFNPFAMFNQDRNPAENRNTNRRNPNRNTNNRNTSNRKPSRFPAPDLQKDDPTASAGKLNLRRFRGNENALRSMPPIMIINAYALNAESSAEKQMDKLFMRAFREKANKYPVPDHLYEAIIQKLVTGATVAEEMVAGKSRADILKPAVRSNFCPDANCDVPLSLREIWGYGCWCTFELEETPGIMDGSSVAVNKFDAACMNMKKCLRCALHDGANASPPYECDARYNRNYNALYNLNLADQGLNADCTSQNPGDECGEHLCSCEVNLVSEVLDLLWDGDQYDADYLHAQGFSQEDSCPSTSQNSSPERVCCGQYPDRQFVDAEVYHCCDTRTRYNVFTEQCCGDGLGTVEQAGEC